jgi:uncharacterized membrane protein YqjE
MTAPDSPGAPPPGLLGSARRLLRTSLGLVATRLQILGTEVEEEQVRFTGLVFLLAGIAFCFFTAALLVVALVVVLLWDTHRITTLVVFTLLFLGAGIGGLLIVRRRRRRRPPLFSATIGEIAKDLERIREQA